VSRFDTFVVVDWSGGNDRGPTPKADAIWAGVARGPGRAETRYFRNRALAEGWLTEFLSGEVAAGRRVLAGFDFPFGYPAGFAAAVTGRADPLALWDWLEARLEDTPEANTRFDLAARLNAATPGTGPFWGNGLKRDIPGLPRRKPDFAEAAYPEWRAVERAAPGAFSCWQLAGAGSVGSQMLTGLPVLARLRRALGARAWPFEPLDGPVALVEVWPSLLRGAVAAELAAEPGAIRDEVQVRLLARALAAVSPEALAAMLEVEAPEEGWILGLGHEAVLEEAAAAPPPLANDCFALPPGVEWTPVDVALDRLRGSLAAVTGIETRPLAEAGGRVLARDLAALRANPPGANTAVDGWGFAHATLPEARPCVLPCATGRAAPGSPHRGTVPPGQALRVLTGALLPEGVDSVVLDEDVQVAGGEIRFARPPKPGANTRKAGEDKPAGAPLLPAGRALTPADLALLAATGHAAVPLRKRLRVAVLSTGSELAEPDPAAPPSATFDANRPMLLALAECWGHDAVDLGRVPDDRAALRAAMDRGAREADVILTSGGASAGDEDHVSALLGEAGTRATWRIALKPGRPLALGFWGAEGRQVPVFGLPGNPVAAFTCALIFARPALSVLAGGGWLVPQGYAVPATFAKAKKPGRREYLRARLDADGRAEVFASEGSGRVSGLSWGEGFVELPDGAAEIAPGTMVRFLPYGSFGL
jgi:molybdopterin molybdotransferase